MSKKIFALEELNEEEAIVIAPEESNEEISGQLAQSATEIDDLSDQINHAEEVEETISGIGENLSRLKPAETIPAPAMEAINIAIDGLLNSIGMPNKSRKVALEGFSKATTAMESMEAIKGIAIRIWEAIKKAFFAMVDYVKKFFAWIKKSIAGVTAKANAVEKQIAEVKKEHSSSDISAAEKKVEAATAELFKGNAFTASSSSPEYLKLANNPSPEKPDFKYDIGVGKNPKATDGSIEYYDRLAIKNKKLAHYFRNRGSGDSSNGNNFIKSGVSDFTYDVEKIFEEIKKSAAGVVKRIDERGSHGLPIGSQRKPDLANTVLYRGVCPIIKVQVRQAESGTLTGFFENLDRLHSTGKVHEMEADSPQAGLMRLPFDEDIRILPETKPGPTISFTKGGFSDTNSNNDLIQLCYLDDANYLTKMIIKNANLGEDVLSDLEKNLERLLRSGDVSLEKAMSDLNEEISDKYTEPEFVARKQTQVEEWKTHMRDIRVFFDFAIKDVSMLMLYRQKMNTHLLEWFSESTREWQRILTPAQVASALAKNNHNE